MAINKHVFLGLIIVSYIVAFVETFDALYDSLMIMSVALIGLCGWFYGIRIGLLSVFLFVIINTIILFIISGQPCDILLTYNPLGLILSVISVLATGSMRESQDRLNKLKTTLTSRVAEATAELDKLTLKLIENDEAERIRIGQDLHDGIGQYLTGMLLHSEALACQLAARECPEATLAEKMKELVQNEILLVRQFSRSFLPNHLGRSGFDATMNEMVDYLRETTQTRFHLQLFDSTITLPHKTALHLYRIIQESIFCLLNECGAKQIGIYMLLHDRECSLIVDGHECDPLRTCEIAFQSKTLKYRARTINGTLAFTNPSAGNLRLLCSSIIERGNK